MATRIRRVRLARARAELTAKEHQQSTPGSAKATDVGEEGEEGEATHEPRGASDEQATSERHEGAGEKADHAAELGV